MQEKRIHWAVATFVILACFLLYNQAVGQETTIPPILQLLTSGDRDCHGVKDGVAYFDNCNRCVGGSTGISACVQDCNGDWGGIALIDNCLQCAGGDTGIRACIQDCNGDWGGTAYLDSCDICVGGNTGVLPCSGVVEVVSAGQTWMDRNIGAVNVGERGGMFQWGRLADGHENSSSQTTSVRSIGDDPGHDKFITVGIAADPDYDWRTTRNDLLWQGVSGTNNPCPAGFRLPTETEFETERTSWISNDTTGAMASSLKLVTTGVRKQATGAVGNTYEGYYWSSTTQGSYFSRYLKIAANSEVLSYYRSAGFCVRCIKD